MNQTDFCSETTQGVDDLLCQVMKDNSIYDWVQNTTFPISICHSPNDSIIPISHVPDISSSSSSSSSLQLLSKGTILGRGPDGDHMEASIFCHMVQILQFTSLGTSRVPLSGIEPLSDPSSCRQDQNASSVSPVLTPTRAPPYDSTPTTFPMDDSNNNNNLPTRSSHSPSSWSMPTTQGPHANHHSDAESILLLHWTIMTCLILMIIHWY
jgi:hypothetical protein